MTLLLLCTSLGLVTLGADFLVRGASTLALRAGVSPLFVGLTIVAFGTSTPELGASLDATLRGSGDVGIGNVVGSNIFNIGVILAVTALIRPITIRLAVVRRDLLVALAAATVPWMSWIAGGVVTRWLGTLMLAGLAIYLHSAYRAGRRAHAADRQLAREALSTTRVIEPRWKRLRDATWVQMILIIAGIALLAGGSRVFVGSAITVARILGVSELVIGLTIVAVGTSLPELVTSLVAAARRSHEIAVGNIIGSNIFNLLGILGTCAVFRPQTLRPHVLLMDTPVMVAVTIALLPIVSSGGRISRAEGGILLAAYLGYLAIIFLRPA
jgi:cation:H+ antiporter